MRQSKLFYTVKRDAPKDEMSVNAKFLLRGGFIQKLSAGVYSFLPLGVRVFKNIERIIREEINAVGGQELFMPALQPKELWEETGRYASMDDLYKIKDRQEKDFVLGTTHEEVITDIVRKNVSSYKQLPLSLYQIQTKFRDEFRAKSGLLRGREFVMKDLYSFHTSEEDRKVYYQNVRAAYVKIFARAGLDVIIAQASGGSFSKEYSEEFQVETPAGEDIIFVCDAGDFAQNREISQVKAGDACPHCGKPIREAKTIEVGNIFTLGTKYSTAMGARYRDAEGKEQPLIMGCYGIGLNRLMGTTVEIHHDEQGIIWPKELAPYQIHLVNLLKDSKGGDALYESLQSSGLEVLYDERTDKTAGEKFADADMIGIPTRIVISDRTLEKKAVEVKMRNSKESSLVPLEDLKQTLETQNSR